MTEALSVHIQGVVQGVGFRPFVYRLAHTHNIRGWVLNAVDGVHIHAEGEPHEIDGFVLDISEHAPEAARVSTIEMTETGVEDFERFEIRESDDKSVQEHTLVSPDLATCDECVKELFDPNDRRYHYPFINCTNCGPRFTIVDHLPYDRAATSMSHFEMCPECSQEYRDPLNRRFHAQPDACFACGPHISFTAPMADQSEGVCDVSDQSEGISDTSDQLKGDYNAALSTQEDHAAPTTWPVTWGNTREISDAIIERTAQMLHEGRIVAIKGLGGFHLACDASNSDAIARLRARKHRDGKALACMVSNVDEARMWCQVSPEEEKLLKNPAHPIVLLRKKDGVSLAPGLADYLPELGIMLPATPLQHLLLHAFGGMLVMTSGNVHGDPIQTDDAFAREALAGIADAFVGNDRPILSRYDDSVARVLHVTVAGEQTTFIQYLRRARGLAPMPVELPEKQLLEHVAQHKIALPSVLATGPEQKVTFTETKGSRAFVSQHIGDMEHVAAYDSWLALKDHYARLFDITPDVIAYDEHPEHLTTKWALQQPGKKVAVQHHHAHIASAMAENGLYGPVIGIAFDGTGYGEDGRMWGGETLIANLTTFERFANFSYMPMPGGAAAIHHPLRMTYGMLWAYGLLDHPAAARVLTKLGDTADMCDAMINKGLNTPYTSSVGRIYDAISALIGVCEEPTYEGEGAVLLEAAISDPVLGCCAVNGGVAADDTGDPYRIDIAKNAATDDSTALDTSVVLFDCEAMLTAILDDIEAGIARGVIAKKFHDAIVGAICTIAQLANAVYGITTVALSGGVFMNRYIMEHSIEALSSAGFTVALNQDLPPNDACISYGQAVVAISHEIGLQ